MDRREALRAATVISAGAIVSACDPGARPATPPSTSSPASPPFAGPTTTTRMSAARAHAEINDCARALRSLTGSIGRWFRPSQTQYATSMIKDQARLVGYATCLSYDVDSLDYTDAGDDAVVANTLKAAGNGSIISLHFGTPARLPRWRPYCAACAIAAFSRSVSRS